MVIVVWVAYGVGFGMQVIDPAQVMIDSPALCTAFGQSAQDGHCLLKGRAEANFDRTWAVTIAGKEPVSFIRESQFAMVYNSADWHMRGGALGVWALGLVSIVLSCAWPAYDLWRGRKK